MIDDNNLNQCALPRHIDNETFESGVKTAKNMKSFRCGHRQRLSKIVEGGILLLLFCFQQNVDDSHGMSSLIFSTKCKCCLINDDLYNSA